MIDAMASSKRRAHRDETGAKDILTVRLGIFVTGWEVWPAPRFSQTTTTCSKALGGEDMAVYSPRTGEDRSLT